MLYFICKAKNKIAMNEQEPKFNSENWEIIETANCRKNATQKTWELVFYPIYQRLRELYGSEQYRLWNFKMTDVQSN